VAERRTGTGEDGAAAGHIQRGGLRMDGGAAARVGRFGGFGESSYGIDRLWLLSQGRTPYVDFEWPFGAALLYGPLLLRHLLPVDLVQAYYIFWVLNSLLGVLLLFTVINMVDYPTDDKKTIYLLLYYSGFLFILFMGLQYTFVRYILPLFFILVVHRILRSESSRSRVYAALVAVVFTVILLLNSPETAIAHAFACVCVFLLSDRGLRGRSFAIFAGLLFALAAVFWSAMKLHVLDSVKASGGGADSFPIILAPHILVFFAALFVCACYGFQRLTERRIDDNTIGLIAYSIPMTAAAWGVLALNTPLSTPPMPSSTSPRPPGVKGTAVSSDPIKATNIAPENPRSMSLKPRARTTK